MADSKGGNSFEIFGIPIFGNNVPITIDSIIQFNEKSTLTLNLLLCRHHLASDQIIWALSSVKTVHHVHL